MDAVLAVGAAVRLTRLIVDDDLGQWWVKDPVDRAMDRYNETHEEEPWWWKYRSGLDCPWCVGYWVGTAVLASALLSKGHPAWRFVAASLTLNEIVGRTWNDE